MTVFAGPYPAFSIACDRQIQRGFGGRQIGREAAFVADIGVMAGSFERGAQRMKNLRPSAQSFGERCLRQAARS